MSLSVTSPFSEKNSVGNLKFFKRDSFPETFLSVPTSSYYNLSKLNNLNKLTNQKNILDIHPDNKIRFIFILLQSHDIKLEIFKLKIH